MAKKRTSREVIEQVLQLFKEGRKIRAIERCTGLSRNTVRKIIREHEESVKAESAPAISCLEQDWREAVNWDLIQKEAMRGVTIKVLHREHAPEGISYKKFWTTFWDKCDLPPEVTMRLTHKPGEKTFFDFCDGIYITDRKTGKKTSTEFFCGVLPFSSYTYGEFVLNQKQSALMTAIERTWHFIGGVTPYVTVDNLKAGVRRAHLYDPDVNVGFCDFANHWGFAVIPARPYKAKDKAANEGGIGVIQRSFFNEVRNRTFYSLEELNSCFWEFLKILNNQEMKDHGNISRSERFQTEKPLLKSLARINYEVSEWKTAKVHADCHVQVDRRFYSVPYQFVGRTVRVRLTHRMIEIFNEDNAIIAVHSRLYGDKRVVTLDSHYPEQKVGIARFEIKHAKSQASKIGPETEKLVNALVDQVYPLKYLRRIQGIVRLVQSGRVSKQGLEHACKQALVFKNTRYEFIKSTALFFDVNGRRPVLATPERNLEEVYLHNQPNRKENE
jgi:transposase